MMRSLLLVGGIVLTMLGAALLSAAWNRSAVDLATTLPVGVLFGVGVAAILLGLRGAE